MYGCSLDNLSGLRDAVKLLLGVSVCRTPPFRSEVSHHYFIQLIAIGNNAEYYLCFELTEQFVCKSPGTYFVYREVGDIVEEFLPSFGGFNEVVGVSGNLCWRSCSLCLMKGRCKCNI